MPAILKSDMPLDASQHRGGPGPPGFKSDVSEGTRLKIYWPAVNSWFSGEIRGVLSKGWYSFQYDIGDSVRNVRLASLVWDYEDMAVERCLKRQKVVEENGKPAEEGMPRFRSKIAGLSSTDSKLEAGRGQASLVWRGVKEAKGRLHGKGIEKLARSAVEDVIAPAAARGDHVPGSDRTGRRCPSGRARKPSALVRDILGGNAEGGGNLDCFTLAAANLLAPIAQEDEPTAASTLPRESKRLAVEKGQWSPQPRTSPLKPPTPTPANNSAEGPCGSAAKRERVPSPATSLTEDQPEVPDRELPAPEGLSTAPPEMGAPVPQSQSDDLTVELSPTCSPRLDGMHSPLAEGKASEFDAEGNKLRPDFDLGEASRGVRRDEEEGNGMREEDKGLPSIKPEVATLDKVEPAGPATGKLGHRKPSQKRLRAPDVEGARGTRSLADIYKETGDESPALSHRKKVKGVVRGPHRRTRALGGSEKSPENRLSAGAFGKTYAGALSESAKVPARLRLEKRIAQLPDSNLSLEGNGLHILRYLLEVERESGGKDAILDKDKMVGEPSPADTSQLLEEESDELLAQTLLGLREQNGTGFLGTPWQASHAPSFAGLQSVVVSEVDVGRSSEGTMGRQPCEGKDCRTRDKGSKDVKNPGENGGGRWGHGNQRFVKQAGGKSAGLHPRLTESAAGFVKADPSKNPSKSETFTPGAAHMKLRPETEQCKQSQLPSEGPGLGAEGRSSDLVARCQRKDNGLINGDRNEKWEGTMATPKSRSVEGRALAVRGPSLEAERVSEGGEADVRLRVIDCNGIGSKGRASEMETKVTATLPAGQPLSQLVGRLQDHGLPTPEGHSGTESDLSGSIYCVIDDNLCGQSNLVVCGRLGVGSSLGDDAKGGALEIGQSPKGVLSHRPAGRAHGQGSVLHAGGGLPEFHPSREFTRKSPEDILLSNLQVDPRRRAKALQRVLGAGGLAGWLDNIGLKEQTEHLGAIGMTAERIIGIGHDEAKMMGLTVGSRVRLMTAIGDLYRD